MYRDIPSIPQIKAASNVISPPDASAKVVRVNEKFAVKFGTSVSISEAETMRYIAAKSTVPLPQVHATFSEPESGLNFIVMDYLEGVSLQTLLPSLDLEEKLEISTQLKAIMDQLRQIKEPGYLGSIDHKPLVDGVFWTPDNDRSVSGPFLNESELNKGILRRLRQTEEEAHIRFLGSIMSTTLQNHRTVFTHGDLQPKNIIVDRIRDSNIGTSSFKISIIDWEVSGWYPEYWEFCNATITGRLRADWLDMARSILTPYPNEYLMMHIIRGILFY